MVSVVGREVNICGTGQGHHGHDCDWSILQAMAANGQQYTHHSTV